MSSSDGSPSPSGPPPPILPWPPLLYTPKRPGPSLAAPAPPTRPRKTQRPPAKQPNRHSEHARHGDTTTSDALPNPSLAPGYANHVPTARGQGYGPSYHLPSFTLAQAPASMPVPPPLYAPFPPGFYMPPLFPPLATSYAPYPSVVYQPPPMQPAGLCYVPAPAVSDGTAPLPSLGVHTTPSGVANPASYRMAYGTTFPPSNSVSHAFPQININFYGANPSTAGTLPNVQIFQQPTGAPAAVSGVPVASDSHSSNTKAAEYTNPLGGARASPAVPHAGLDRSVRQPGGALAQDPIPPTGPQTSGVPAKCASAGATLWDPWPDGLFECNYSMEFYQQSNQLVVHWACSPLGGSKKGDLNALRWQDGKCARRKCRGIIRCDNTVCRIVIRPQTRDKGITKQLNEHCRCGGDLEHHDCGIVSQLWHYSSGVYYINGGDHSHPRPTHLLHITDGERAQFTELVTQHPTTGPLALLVGVPTLHGPGKSAADITPVFNNKDRIRFERRAIKAPNGSKGDSFLKEFALFESENPGLVILSQMGAVTVIALQSKFMASQILRKDSDHEAINGLVSDAAHGFWLDHNAILILSSTYCDVLHCWTPSICSYSNGASAEHYELHFLALMRGLAREADTNNVPVTDSLFRSVCLLI